MAEDIPTYSIRHMKEEEIPAVMEMWKETNLSEGTHSVESWFHYDPEGFYVAVTEDDTVLGVCAGILQHENLAFVGLYVVKSEYRGRGIGLRIWQAVMDRIGDRNAGVNPVPSQLANYRDRGGFPVQTSWHSVVCVANQLRFDNLDHPDLSIQLLKSDDAILDDVIAYDADVNGFFRGDIVTLTCEEEESLTMVATRKDNTVCGYGNIKNNIKGNALIGPLYADDEEVAEFILSNLVEHFPMAKCNGVTMMIVDCNETAMQLTDKLGFNKEPGIARLYRSQEVEAQFDKIFGQHNLNFSVF